MFKKNEFTIGILALLLSFGLVGSAFASDRNYIELDESDYGEINSGFETNADQTNSAVNAEVVQNETQVPTVAGWVNLIELDESDYEYATPGNTSKRVLCAGTGSTGQMNGC